MDFDTWLSPLICRQALSWLRYAVSPSDVSGWIGYVAKLDLRVAFSASVAGGLAVFAPNKLPPPPLVLLNGLFWVGCEGG